MMTSVVTR